jgi:hypothetical protein
MSDKDPIITIAEQEETPPPTSRTSRRQVLGKRMGLTPYYTITNHKPATYLLVQSRPKANARAGYIFMAVGALLSVISVSFFCVGYASSSNVEQMGPLLGGMFCALPFGVVGGLGLIGGLAIVKTINTITVDSEAQTGVFHQKARRERKQTLQFDQIARLRLATQSFAPPGILQNPRPVAVVEIITDEEHTWLVDSAEQVEDIMPIAEAMADVLHMPLLDERDQPQDDQIEQDVPHTPQ